MLNVALTGNVAAGKSSVQRRFAAWGATVIDADALVREAQSPGSPVLDAIAERFGSEVLTSSGTLRREELRQVVMQDDMARSDLEAIVHPEVNRRRQRAVASARNAGDLILIHDIPLLFEALDPDQFDVVVLVDAPPATRRSRLVQIRGLAESQADQLMAAQMDSAGKRERSDFIIDNDGSREDLEVACEGVWVALRCRAARAAAGREHGSVVILAPDLQTFITGPVGTAARYVDAGLDIHLGLGAPSADEAIGGLEEILRLAGVYESPWTPHGVLAARERLRPDLVVLAEPIDAVGTSWVWARPDADADVCLDVRPWIRVVEAAHRHAGRPVRTVPPRERFQRVPRASGGHFEDLFGPG